MISIDDVLFSCLQEVVLSPEHDEFYREVSACYHMHIVHLHVHVHMYM